MTATVASALVGRIYCCGCAAEVSARLTDGREIYQHRQDLSGLPFWVCDACGNFVGCHHKTNDRTRPLGSIPTPKLREARKHLHALIDPIWKSGQMPRRALYAKLSAALGREYHTAEIRTLEEARSVHEAIANMKGPS